MKERKKTILFIILSLHTLSLANRFFPPNCKELLLYFFLFISIVCHTLSSFYYHRKLKATKICVQIILNTKVDNTFTLIHMHTRESSFVLSLASIQSTIFFYLHLSHSFSVFFFGVFIWYAILEVGLFTPFVFFHFLFNTCSSNQFILLLFFSVNPSPI